MLEKLAQDTDMDVKYFAQEAISGKHLSVQSHPRIIDDKNQT